MAIGFANDLLSLFAIEDFATTATYQSSDLIGIFDNETVPVDAGGIAAVHQEQPRFTCKTADVSNIAEDDFIVISNVEYRVVAWLHDGTGVTTIQLEKQ